MSSNRKTESGYYQMRQRTINCKKKIWLLPREKNDNHLQEDKL